MSEFVTGGGLQATGGLLSSLISTIGNSIVTNRQNRKNRNFQAQQAQLQRDWQEDMYNKYSSPSAMVKQYQEAGLNPALAYGNPTGQTFSGGTPAGGSSMQPDWSGANAVGENLINLLSVFADIELKKEQAESEQAGQEKIAQEITESQNRIELNEANIRYFNKQIDDLNSQISARDSKLNKELNYIDNMSRLLESQKALTDAQAKKLEDDIRLINSQISLNEQQKVYYASLVTLNEVQKTLIESQKSLTDSQKSLTDSQKSLTDSQKSLTDSQKSKVDAEKKSINRDIWKKEFENTFLSLYGVTPSSDAVGTSLNIFTGSGRYKVFDSDNQEKPVYND